MKISRVLIISILSLLILGSAAFSDKVLVVTSLPDQKPVVYSYANGCYVISDLASSGLPFDVTTYSSFVNSDLDGYDVIILNGHCSPLSTSTILNKCTEAMNNNKKLFINGTDVFKQYDENGVYTGIDNFSNKLFPVNAPIGRKLNGVPEIPSFFEKSSDITSIGYLNNSAFTYTFNSNPNYIFSSQGYAFGFLYDNGGLIDSSGDFGYRILDYGKIASYLKYGKQFEIGFALGRYHAQPIASFEVHCDNTNNITAIENLDKLSTDHMVPLVNLLLYKNLDQASIEKWNQIISENPLMFAGSHSKTHPSDWPSLPDVLQETYYNILNQKQLIPDTINYLNFSGDMNPDTTQIGILNEYNVLYGAKGYTERIVKKQDGSSLSIQRMPVDVAWLRNIASGDKLPFCLAQTVLPDNTVTTKTIDNDFTDEVKLAFEQNLKYNLYTYGFFHDYMLDPNTNHYSNGIHVSEQIKNSLSFLDSQQVYYMPINKLISNLRDFASSSITINSINESGCNLSFNRPNALINELRAGPNNGLIAVASGQSVLAQRYIDTTNYIELVPENNSTINIDWYKQTPEILINKPSVMCTNSANIDFLIEYKYAKNITLSNSDITLIKTGTANGNVSIIDSGDSNKKIVRITNVIGDGTLNISIAANTAVGFSDAPALAAASDSSVIIDNTAPEMHIEAPSVSKTISGPVSYQIVYTGADSISLTSDKITINKTGTANCLLAISGTDKSSRTVTLTNITGEGTLGISISEGSASDNAGNLAGAAGPSETVILESNNFIEITYPKDAAVYNTNNNTIDISGTANDGASKISWMNSLTGKKGNCSGKTNWSVKKIKLIPGDNIITINTIDKNKVIYKDTLLVTYVDITPPIIKITSPSSKPIYSTTKDSVLVGGSTSDSDIIDSIKWTNESNTTSGACSFKAGSKTSFKSSAIKLTLGLNKIILEVKDRSGNISNAIINITKLDKVKPKVNITIPSSKASLITNETNITLGGTASDNTEVAKVEWLNKSTGASGVCNSLTSWEAASIPLQEGKNDIIITVSDSSNNKAFDSMSITKK